MDLNKINSNKLKSLKENDLRKKVIIPLLNEIIGSECVIDMHGRNEEGIDVYFEANDIFGHRRRFGIQIKKGDIVCKNCPNPKSIMTILYQIESAFSKEIILVDSEHGKISVNIDGYYIFISGKTNEPAANRIYQKRKAYPFVHIIDGDELLKIIKNRDSLKKRMSEPSVGSPLSVPLNNELPKEK